MLHDGPAGTRFRPSDRSARLGGPSCTSQCWLPGGARAACPYEQLARIVIRRRIDLGLTQEQLAKRMGTSHSAISRIESGQHSTSVQTLQRLAVALEMRFVMGFEHGPTDKPVRELVPA